MSIIERFLEDHREFRQHLRRALDLAASLTATTAAPPLTKEDQEFALRLRRHARIESELLFPAMQRMETREEHRRKTVERHIAHGNDEHVSVAKRHAEYHAAASGAPLERWRSTLQQFADGLERHMQLEEEEIFPLARELLSQSVLIDLNQKAEKIP